MLARACWLGARPGLVGLGLPTQFCKTMKGRETGNRKAAKGLQSARTNLAQYTILEEMKVSETEAASRLYKRMALPSKGFPLPRPVPTNVVTGGVKCTRTFRLADADNGATITVKPDFDDFLQVSGFSGLSTTVSGFNGARSSDWNGVFYTETGVPIPDLASGDAEIRASPALHSDNNLGFVSGLNEPCCWQGPFKTNTAATNDITLKAPPDAIVTLRCYGYDGSTWSQLASGVTSGQANMITLGINSVSVPGLSASYDAIAFSIDCDGSLQGQIQIDCDAWILQTAGAAESYPPLQEEGLADYQTQLDGAEYLSITAFSCLVSFMGHTMYDGGQIAAALVPGGADLSSDLDVRFGKLTSLSEHSYNGRLSKGAYGHYIPGRVQDLFFTKQRSIKDGSRLEFVIKNAPAGVDVDAVVRIQTVFCYEVVTNSPVWPKEIGSREHQLVDLLVAFAHMSEAVCENPNHIKIIAEKAKKFSKRPEVKEAMSAALKLAAKGALSLAPLLFP